MACMHVTALPDYHRPTVRLEIDLDPAPEPVTVNVILNIAAARKLYRQLQTVVAQVTDEAPTTPLEGQIPVIRIYDE